MKVSLDLFKSRLAHELGNGMGRVQSVVFPVVCDLWGGMNAHIEHNSQPTTYIFQHNLLPLPATTSLSLQQASGWRIHWCCRLLSLEANRSKIASGLQLALSYRDLRILQEVYCRLSAKKLQEPWDGIWRTGVMVLMLTRPTKLGE